MALLSEVIEGLTIIMKHGDGHNVCAEHDILYAGPGLEEEGVAEEDRKRLDELGWHYDNEVGSWARFV